MSISGCVAFFLRSNSGYLERTLSETIAQIRTALAASLFRDGLISLGKAMCISGLLMVGFIQHLGELGMDIVRHDETVEQSVHRVLALAEHRGLISSARNCVQEMQSFGYRVSLRFLDG